MKLKIKDFKGIYTNIDENDNRLELTRESENFLHRRGYLELDPRYLAEDSNLPTPSTDFPAFTWVFETGIYTTLSSDILTTADIPVPSKHDVLILIAKAEVGGTYHRVVYLYDITNSEGWYEMSNKGNYTKVNSVPIIDILNYDGVDFDNSFFSTTIDGTVHFQVENGRLKLYFPHDTFWLGKIDRKIWVKDLKVRAAWGVTADSVTTFPNFDYENDYWYIDRVLDDWEHTKQLVNIETLNTSQYLYTSSSDFSTLICAQPDSTSNDRKRRTGMIYDLALNTTLADTVGARDINTGDPHDDQIRAEAALDHRRCLRHSITDLATGLPVLNPDLPFPVSPEIWLWILDRDRTAAVSPGDWTFNSGDYATMYLYFTTEQADFFRLSSGAEWSTLGSYAAKATGGSWKYEVSATNDGPFEFSISLQDFYNNQIEYSGNQTISDLGWETGENKFSIVATYVIDEREEIPVHVQNYAPNPADKYAINIANIRIPWDISKRVTRIRFYHRLEDGSDYDMIKEFNLLAAEASIEDFEFVANDYTGNTLAANIGFLWDYYEHPSDLKFINGFIDFVTESSVSIGISSRDAVAIYHSTFGGGSLMPDLVYDNNRLPITGVSNLTAVANADGRLMAFTDNTAYIVKAEEIAGIIGFRFEDTVELGVKNKLDVANIQGGVCVHTQHGIYITNGYETKLVSDPINDIVIANYSTGRIYYNRYKHEVYYKPTNAEDLYRFRMIDSVWELVNKTAA